MKTGVMAYEKLALPSQEYFLYIKVVLNCNNIAEYYYLYCIYDQIKTALVSIKKFLQTPKSGIYIYIYIYIYVYMYTYYLARLKHLDFLHLSNAVT